MTTGITTTGSVGTAGARASDIPRVAGDDCCERSFEHVHAPKKEDFEKGKVTSNKGVPHVTETEEDDEAEVDE